MWKLTQNTGLLHSRHILSQVDASQYSTSLRYHHAIVKVFVPHVRISLKANYFLHAPLPASSTSGDAHIHQCVWNSSLFWNILADYHTTMGSISTVFLQWPSVLTLYHWQGRSESDLWPLIVTPLFYFHASSLSEIRTVSVFSKLIL